MAAGFESDTLCFGISLVLYGIYTRQSIVWTESGEIRRFQFVLSVFWMVSCHRKHKEGFWLKAKRQCSNKALLQLAMAAEMWRALSSTDVQSHNLSCRPHFGSFTREKVVWSLHEICFNWGGGVIYIYFHLPALNQRDLKTGLLSTSHSFGPINCPSIFLLHINIGICVHDSIPYLHRCSLLSRVQFNTWAEIHFIYPSTLILPCTLISTLVIYVNVVILWSVRLPNEVGGKTSCIIFFWWTWHLLQLLLKGRRWETSLLL